MEKFSLENRIMILEKKFNLVFVILTLMIVFSILFNIASIINDFANTETESNERIVEKTEKVNTIDKKNETIEPGEGIETPFTIYDRNGLTAVINKIANKETLRIYVSYSNKSGEVIELTESLCKVVSNNKQEECDTLRSLDLIENPLYELENNVEYDSIMVFDKIDSETFDFIFNIDYNEVKFNLKCDSD